MDTTKLEYELKMLQERLAILESQRDKDRSDLNMVVRKTAGAVDPMPDVKQLETRDASKYQKWAVGPFGPEPQFMNPSPKPKFWKCYKATTDETAKPLFWDKPNFLAQCAQPVYCFTREMLIELLEKYETTIYSYGTFLDSYLKSNGGV